MGTHDVTNVVLEDSFQAKHSTVTAVDVRTSIELNRGAIEDFLLSAHSCRATNNSENRTFK